MSDVGSDRTWIKVEVDNLYEWMRRITLSERARIPCHWMECSGAETGRKWLFRGQPGDHEFGIKSTLERIEKVCKCTDAVDRQRIEEHYIDEFRRRSSGMLAGRGLTDFDMVALMRHYGVPTRLIDFTYSAYVALYFAANSSPLKNTGKFSVWAISLDDLSDSSGRCDDDGSILDFTAASDDASSCEYRIYDDTKGLFTDESFGPKPHSKIYFARPRIDNERSNAQLGVFLLQSSLEHGFMDDLTDCVINHIESVDLKELREDDLFKTLCSESMSRVVTFEFPESLRQEAILTLKTMNIFPHTLFPDLDGIAKTVISSVNELDEIELQ